MITSEQEYVSFLKEIQESGSVVYTTIPSTEPRLLIDANTREITISSKFPFLAVKHDHRAETIYFEINRYFDDVDLVNHTCIIQYINKSKTGEVSEGYHYVQEMDIDSVEGKIIFGWMIENPATKFNGDIVFSVRFYTIIGDKFDYNFNTKPAHSTIEDTLQVCNADDYIYPSEFEIWVSKIDDIASDIAEAEKYMSNTIEKAEQELVDKIKETEDDLVAKVEETKYELVNKVAETEDALVRRVETTQSYLEDKMDEATKNIENLLSQTTEQANIATEKASISTEQANIAINKATTATEQANIASAKATIATEQANIATNKANVATTQATTATEKANIATENALEAIEQAEIATTQAGIATEQANIATEKSNIILDNVDLATEKASVSTQQAEIATTQAGIATTQAENASKFADEVEDYSLLSQSYAIGGSGTRENEDTDNSKYYYEQSKAIKESLDVVSVDELKTFLGI